MPEKQLIRFVEGYTLDQDKLWGFSFRCLGSTKWIDASAFLRLAKSAQGISSFPSRFFDNPDEKREPIFYPVSRRKFFVMSVCTFGIYYLYWEYKTWSYYRKVAIQFDKWYAPFLHTMSDILFPEGLIIRGHLWEYVGSDLSPTQTVTSPTSAIFVRYTFIILGFLAIFPPTRVFIVFPLLSQVAYLPIVKTINDINIARMPEYAPDDHFSLLQRIWIATSLIIIVGIVVFLYSL